MNWDVNFKNITVKMFDGRVHTGKVNIRDFKRLSDFLRNKGEEFIVIVPNEGDPDSEVLMLNKSYIVEAKEAAGQETTRSGDTSVVSMLDQSRS